MKKPLPPCISCDAKYENCHTFCDAFTEYKSKHEAYKAITIRGKQENMKHILPYNKKLGGKR